MRGKQRLNFGISLFIGITPAGAGKTGLLRFRTLRREDHPRRCGENLKILDFALFPMGSPPQVRGKRNTAHSIACGAGITPAGAGKTKVNEMNFSEA